MSSEITFHYDCAEKEVLQNNCSAAILLLPIFSCDRTIISSLELKAQVSFSEQNLSVVCRRWHCSKLFTFSSFSTPEPMGRFQPNLA